MPWYRQHSIVCRRFSQLLLFANVRDQCSHQGHEDVSSNEKEMMVVAESLDVYWRVVFDVCGRNPKFIGNSPNSTVLHVHTHDAICPCGNSCSTSAKGSFEDDSVPASNPI